MSATIELNGYTQPVYVQSVVQDECVDPDTLEVCRAIRMIKASVQHWSCMRRWGHAPLEARLSCLSILNDRIDKMQEEVIRLLKADKVL